MAGSADDPRDDLHQRLVDEWFAAASGQRLRSPSQLIVRRGLQSDDDAKRRRAIEIMVDDCIIQTADWLDRRSFPNGGFLDALLESRIPSSDSVDEFLEIYDSDVRALAMGSDPVRLRRATGACLSILPEIERESPPRRSTIDLLNRGGGTGGERRALRRSLEDAQVSQLNAETEQELRIRDVLEAFILATEDDPLFALTRSAFRLIASSLVADVDVADTIRRALSERA